MDWANERWIRLYTRDTGDWLMWPWQTRAIFLFILRKVDRAGTMQLGKGNLFALAAMIGMPSHDVTEWIEPLVDDGCVQIRDGVLCVPNFREAQETVQTDKARQRDSRERSRNRALSGTESHGLSRGVTPSHVLSLQDKTRLEETDERESDAREIREEPRSEARLKSVPPLPPDPPEAAADDLRWSPERSEDSATRKGAGKSAVASGESGYDLARRVFSEAWAKHYREPYAFGGGPFFGPQSEDVNLRDIGDLALDRDRAKADDLLRHVAKNYMRDKKPLFVNERHPARYFGVDLMNKYGAPPKQKCQLRAASATETQLQPVVGALAPDAVANLTSGFLAKIGKAGGT